MGLDMGEGDPRIPAAEGRRRGWVLALYVALVVMGAAASRTERGMFTFPVPGQATAFAASPQALQTDGAITQGGPLSSLVSGGIGLGPRGQRTASARNGPGALGTPGTPLPGSTDTAALPGGVPDIATGTTPLTTLTTPGDGDSGDGSGTPGGPGPSLPIPGLFLTSVPETGTWAMMIIGFGSIGGVLRRRRSSGLAEQASA